MAVLVSISAACLVVACGNRLSQNNDRLAANQPAHRLRSDMTPIQPGSPAVNARDLKGDDPTVMDHSEALADRDTTRRIRDAVMTDRTLSMAAYNVTIITIEGRVMLRGPVATESERLFIQEKANDIVGATNVDNQLVVKKQ
jgi:osmotically-inducible protein OsmY